jgi:hypothetical protein
MHGQGLKNKGPWVQLLVRFQVTEKIIDEACNKPESYPGYRIPRFPQLSTDKSKT